MRNVKNMKMLKAQDMKLGNNSQDGYGA